MTHNKKPLVKCVGGAGIEGETDGTMYIKPDDFDCDLALRYAYEKMVQDEKKFNENYLPFDVVFAGVNLGNKRCMGPRHGWCADCKEKVKH